MPIELQPRPAVCPKRVRAGGAMSLRQLPALRRRPSSTITGPTILLVAGMMLVACSASAPDAARTDHNTPTRIGAAAIVRAYAQDVDEADVEFVGHPLVIAGDVVRTDRTGLHLVLTTGSSAERLPATVTSSPHPVSPKDLVTLRCDRIDRDASRPRVSRCVFLAIIPARIAQGG